MMLESVMNNEKALVAMNNDDLLMERVMRTERESIDNGNRRWKVQYWEPKRLCLDFDE